MKKIKFVDNISLYIPSNDEKAKFSLAVEVRDGML